MPSSSLSTTSDGTPRIVEVTGATVTVDKYAMALLRVSTRAGCPTLRFVKGGDSTVVYSLGPFLTKRSIQRVVSE